MQEVETYPKVQPQDVEFLKEETKRILGHDYDFDNCFRASFAGLRPLCLEEPVSQEDYAEKVKTLKSKDLTRSHIIEVSDSGLVSLLGGKWTSYRIMGEE
jgi:glycerol-3-phosphate dehydrogenase